MQEIKLFKAQYNGKEVIWFEIAENTGLYVSNKVMEILLDPKTTVEQVDEIIQSMIWKFNNEIHQTALY